VEELANGLPELPDAKKARFVSEYGITPYDASVLVAEHDRAAFFEQVARGRDAKLAANWLIGDYLGALNKAGRDLASAPVAAEGLGRLIDLIADGTISGRIAKDVFEIMWESGRDPAEIVAEKGLRQVSDTGAIRTMIEQVLEGNADKVAQYHQGKQKLFGFFIGQVMKAAKGKANPQVVNEILRKLLDT